MERCSLRRVSKGQLLRDFSALVGRDRGNTARMLAYIGEIDRRKLYLEDAYPSMFAFCTQRFRMSEAIAAKRIRAGRAACRFPCILGMIGRGDLHLSGVHQLAKHLTEENHKAVLRRAKGRSMREIDGLIAEIAPKPDVVSMIRALPGLRGEEAGGMIQPRTAVLGGATLGDGELWGSGMRESAAGPSLKSGAVPLNDAVVALNREAAALKGAATALNREAVPLKGAALSFKGRALGEASKSRSSGSLDCNAGVRARKGRNLATPLSPGRYKLQVTIGQEARDTLAELQNLLSHQIPDGDPAAVVERALNVLLAETKKKRAALADKPRTRRKEGGGRTRAIPAQVRREVF